MDNRSRRDATIVIWVACTCIAIPAIMFGGYSMGYLWIVVGAIAATGLVWASAVGEAIFTQGKPQYRHSEPEKKDTTAYKLAILMEMMDDDERQDFKYQLKNNLLAGDDSVSLESMVSEKRKRR